MSDTAQQIARAKARTANCARTRAANWTRERARAAKVQHRTSPDCESEARGRSAETKKFPLALLTLIPVDLHARPIGVVDVQTVLLIDWRARPSVGIGGVHAQKTGDFCCFLICLATATCWVASKTSLLFDLPFAGIGGSMCKRDLC